jgi:hypothetical protein
MMVAWTHYSNDHFGVKFRIIGQIPHSYSYHSYPCSDLLTKRSPACSQQSLKTRRLVFGKDGMLSNLPSIRRSTKLISWLKTAEDLPRQGLLQPLQHLVYLAKDHGDTCQVPRLPRPRKPASTMSIV